VGLGRLLLCLPGLCLGRPLLCLAAKVGLGRLLLCLPALAQVWGACCSACQAAKQP